MRFYIRSDLLAHGLEIHKHRYEHCLQNRIKGGGGAGDMCFCAVYMSAIQHRSGELRNCVFEYHDRGHKLYEQQCLLSLLGYFKCNLQPGVTLQEHIGLFSKSVHLTWE